MFRKKTKPVKNLCHDAKIGRVQSVDISMVYGSNGDDSTQASYFSYIEFEAQIGAKKEIYRSREYQSSSLLSEIKGDDCKLVDALWKYAFALTTIPKVRRYANDLIAYGCDVKFEGEPYDDDLINKKIIETMKLNIE